MDWQSWAAVGGVILAATTLAWLRITRTDEETPCVWDDDPRPASIMEITEHSHGITHE